MPADTLPENFLYIGERVKGGRIDTHVKCDGEVFYDGKIHQTFESARCRYRRQMGPHMISISQPNNGRQFVLAEQPDLEREVQYDGFRIPPSMITLKVQRKHQDIHHDVGLYVVRFYIDGDFEVLESLNATQRSAKEWVDFLIDRYLA